MNPDKMSKRPIDGSGRNEDWKSLIVRPLSARVSALDLATWYERVKRNSAGGEAGRPVANGNPFGAGMEPSTA